MPASPRFAWEKREFWPLAHTQKKRKTLLVHQALFSGNQLLALEQATGALPRHPQRPMLFEDHNEDFAKTTLGTRNSPHAMPRVVASTKQKATVIPCIGDILLVEVFKTGRASGRDSTAVIENDRLAAPIPLPICFRIQIKNLGADLPARITVW